MKEKQKKFTAAVRKREMLEAAKVKMSRTKKK